MWKNICRAILLGIEGADGPEGPKEGRDEAGDEGEDDGVREGDADFLVMEEASIKLEAEAAPLADDFRVGEGRGDEDEDRNVHEDQGDPDGALAKHLAKKGLALDLGLVRDGFGAYHAPIFLSPSPRNLRVANIEMAMRTSMTRAMKEPSFHWDWLKFK